MLDSHHKFGHKPLVSYTYIQDELAELVRGDL